jgi:hypothetical protein
VKPPKHYGGRSSWTIAANGENRKRVLARRLGLKCARCRLPIGPKLRESDLCLACEQERDAEQA